MQVCTGYGRSKWPALISLSPALQSFRCVRKCITRPILEYQVVQGSSEKGWCYDVLCTPFASGATQPAAGFGTPLMGVPA